MRTAAAYIRVSTDSQTEYSPDSQLRLIRDYAKRNDMILPDEYIYADEGISGRKADKRPQFQKMLFEGKQKAFEVILIYHTSRFARNHEESVVYRSILKREGIEVVSITQPNIDEKTDLLMNALYSAMDERYSLELAENVKRGMVEKAMRGETVTAVPYGYKKVSYKGTPQVVEPEAAVVRGVYDDFVNQNVPIRNITLKLNDQGIPSPRGKLWGRERVNAILENNFYCGYTKYNVRYSGTGKKRPESEQIIRVGKHKPIISEELFNQAHEKLNRCQRYAKPANIKTHWLSGLVRCEACGAPLNVIRGSSKDRPPFLRCRSYNLGGCSESQYTPAALLEKCLLENLNETLLFPEGAFYEAARKSISDDITKELTAAISRNETKLVRIKAAYESGIDTLEEYGENKKKLQTDIQNLTKQLYEASSAQKLKLTKKSKKRIVEVVGEIIKLLESDADTQIKHDAVTSIIHKIVYSKKNKVFSVYYFL